MVSRIRRRYLARMERQRATLVSASPRLSVFARLVRPPVAIRPGRIRTILQELEDRREWHPEGPARSARGFFIPRHRLVARVSSPQSGRTSSSFQSPFLPSLSSVPISVGFQAPKQVAICIRRKVRREVIFAKGKAGRGVRRRLPTRNFYSEVPC